MVHIPADIAGEVLLRLPVKSLVRFKCISQQFLALISDPVFARLQLERAYKNPISNMTKILLMTPSHFQSVECDTMSFGDRLSLVTFNSPFRKGEIVQFLGSCNGLVALAGKVNFYIWNPCTGDYKKLPYPGISIRLWRGRCCGFGYVSSTNDYKIIISDSGSYDVRNNVYVFSLRKGSWRTICNRYYYYVYSHPPEGCFFGRALHWSIFWETPVRCESMAIALDLEVDAFKEVSMPDVYEAVFLTNPGGGDIGPHNCCFVDTNRVNSHVWVKKQYGLKESWTKLYEIKEDLCPMKFLCLTKNKGFIAINKGRELIRFYQAEDSIEKFKICDDGWCEATVYVESLISPNALDGIGRKVK